MTVVVPLRCNDCNGNHFTVEERLDGNLCQELVLRCVHCGRAYIITGEQRPHPTINLKVTYTISRDELKVK